MAQKAFSKKESIRVVPLHHPKTPLELSELFEGHRGKVPAKAKLTYRGGALLANVEVFTVFWGTGWKTSPQADTAKKINNFFTDILKSSLITQLAEYNVPKFKFGNGKLTGTITITAGAPKLSITDSQIQLQLTKWIGSNKSFPKPGKNTLYFIYFDKGITVSMGGSKSCSSFCGYHDAIGSKTFYAVMPYPGCAGCLGGMNELDALTATSSHELCEAMTDAVPGSGWYDDVNGEIGDICAWQFKKIGVHTVQQEWSNKQKKCV
jgi:hypothetical protein